MSDQAKEMIKRKITLAKLITGTKSSRQLGILSKVDPSTITRAESDDPKSTMSTPNVIKLDLFVKSFIESDEASAEQIALYESEYLNIGQQALQHHLDHITPNSLKKATSQKPAQQILAGFVNSLAKSGHQPSKSLPEIPVYGTAAGSIIGSMQLEEGRQVSYVSRPSGLMNSARAYALIVTGASMSPKFEEGDLVFVDPDRKINAGDTIIIQTKDFRRESDEPTRAYIKTFRGIMDNVLYTEQLNPPAKLDFPLRGKKEGTELVYSYDRVLTTRELFGL
ncbi:S24 family peptidase [uncultured Cohaesibacter sp.]|uniref:S24 family peptidase n=1 Tax=uncultured Cohaesibacter sp. TaxID=1002546 RepID=UPI0029C87581|nr:S24 family peptidase [uncultured Cohaesibacter sp.]